MKQEVENLRLPPHSIEAEQAVLGCCLLGGGETVAEAGEELGLGVEEVFYDLRHQAIFNGMVRLWQDRKPVDVIMLMGLLQATGQLEECGGLSFLNALPDQAVSPANVTYYTEVVREKWQLRRMLGVLVRGVGRIYGDGAGNQPRRHGGHREGGEDRGEETVAQLLDSIEAEVLAVNQRRGGNVIEHIRNPVLRVVEKLENYQRGVGLVGGIRTGLGYFDKMTGGLHAKEMIVIAARPSAGKTSLAMNIVEYVAVDKKQAVGVFSMEMGMEDLSLRMLCSRSGADMQQIRTGFASTRDSELVAAVVPDVSAAPIYFDETPALDIVEMRARARRMVSQHGVRLIVIDYLQLGKAAHAGRRNDNRATEVAAISSGCKAMAKELNIPVVVLSQLNRESEKGGAQRRPLMSDIRESGAIEQDADLIAFLWRPKLDEDEERSAEATGCWPTNLTVAKQRNGPTGDCEVTFDKKRMRFRDAHNNTGRRGEGND